MKTQIVNLIEKAKNVPVETYVKTALIVVGTAVGLAAGLYIIGKIDQNIVEDVAEIAADVVTE